MADLAAMIAAVRRAADAVDRCRLPDSVTGLLMLPADWKAHLAALRATLALLETLADQEARIIMVRNTLQMISVNDSGVIGYPAPLLNKLSSRVVSSIANELIIALLARAGGGK